MLVLSLLVWLMVGTIVSTVALIALAWWHSGKPKPKPAKVEPMWWTDHDGSHAKPVKAEILEIKNVITNVRYPING